MLLFKHQNYISFVLSLIFFTFDFFIIILAKRNKAKSKKKRQSLYSIEFSPPVDTILDYEPDLESNRVTTMELSPKPMTPRRVKRRSVMARGSNNRQSTSSRRSHTNRSSTRSSRRKIQQNPVTKIIGYQQSLQQNSSDGNSYRIKYYININLFSFQESW